MRFTFNGDEWIQGEKPKITFTQWLQKDGYILLTVGLVVIGLWWWFMGEAWIFGDLAKSLTPHQHLWR